MPPQTGYLSTDPRAGLTPAPRQPSVVTQPPVTPTRPPVAPGGYLSTDPSAGLQPTAPVTTPSKPTIASRTTAPAQRLQGEWFIGPDGKPIPLDEPNAAPAPAPPTSRGQAAIDDLKTRTDNAKTLFNTWVKEGPHRVVEGISDLLAKNYSKGLNSMLVGGGMTALGVAAPEIAPAAVAAPLATTAIIGGSLVAGGAAEKAAETLGATPDQAALANTVAQIGAGTAIAKIGVPALAAWGSRRTAASMGKAYEQATRDTMAALGVNQEEAHLARPFLETVHRSGIPIEGKSSPGGAAEQLFDASNAAVKSIEQHIKTVIAQFPQARILAPIRQIARRVLGMPGARRVRGDLDAARKVIAEYGLNRPFTLEQAESMRVRLNAENRRILGGTGAQYRDAVQSDPSYVAREQAAQALRDGIYDTLEANGVEGIRDLRRSEGAILKIRNKVDPLTQGLRGEATVARTGKNSWPRRAAQRTARGLGAVVGMQVGASAGHPVLGAMGGSAVAGDITGSLVAPNLSKNALIERAFQQQFTSPPVMSTQGFRSGPRGGFGGPTNAPGGPRGQGPAGGPAPRPALPGVGIGPSGAKAALPAGQTAEPWVEGDILPDAPHRTLIRKVQNAIDTRATAPRLLGPAPEGPQPAGRTRPTAAQRAAARASERAQRAVEDAALESETLDSLAQRLFAAGKPNTIPEIRTELHARLRELEAFDRDMQGERGDHRAILKFVADEGGLSIPADLENRGELRLLAEERDLKPVRNKAGDIVRHTFADTVNGVRGVFRQASEKVSGGRRGAQTLATMLERVQENGKFPDIQTESQLAEAIKSAARANQPETPNLLKSLMLDVEHEIAARGQAEALSAAEDARVMQEWDDISNGPDDTLDTGEVQPRLPEAGAVREQNIAMPQFEAPFSLGSETSKATRGTQPNMYGEPLDAATQRKADLLDQVETLHRELGHPWGDRDDFSAFVDTDPADLTEHEIRSVLKDLEKLKVSRTKKKK